MLEKLLSIASDWEDVFSCAKDYIETNPTASWKEIRDGIHYLGSPEAIRNRFKKKKINLTKLKAITLDSTEHPEMIEKTIQSEERPIEATKDDQIDHLRAENRTLQRETLRLRRYLGAREEMDLTLLDAIKSIQPIAKRSRSKPKNVPTVTAMIGFSCWHIGEVIDLEETEGFNEYNYEIAKKRLFDVFVPSFLEYINTQRKGYQIDDLVLVFLGDMVSGEIHDELIRTNEFPPPVAAAKAGDLMASVISALSPEFSSVCCECVTADNHGRLDRRKPAKQRGERNWNYVVYHIAETALSKDSSISFNRPKSIQYIFEVEGWRILIEHGDNVRSWMGLPWYGWQRKQGREAWKRQQVGDRFDYQIIGHWHVPVRPFPELFVCGSLAGTSEYDGTFGRFAFPSQTAFLIHKKHGIFNEVPFNLGIPRKK